MDCLPWQDFLDQLTKYIQKEDPALLVHFKSLTTDGDRSKFCFDNKTINENLDAWLKRHLSSDESSSKSKDEYLRLKAEGNKAYIGKLNKKALILYNNALFQSAPGENTGLVYGNRSAVLLQENRLEECLEDISLAMSNVYPEDKVWKLHKRKGEALKRLGRFNDSREEFQKAIGSIRSVDEGLKTEIEKIKNLIKSLPVDESLTSGKLDNEIVATPFGGWSKELKFGGKCLFKKFDDHQGRYIIADREIPAGSVILTEEPYAAVLLKPWYRTHCQHCFQKVSLVIPCGHCSQVCYCSASCRELSWDKYHYFECGKLELLEKLGISRLALRIIVTTPIRELRTFSQESIVAVTDPSMAGYSKNGIYEGGYESVYHLVTNSEHFTVEDILQYSIAGVILSKILTTYSFTKTKGDRDILSSLLIRHIQQLVCNAHAITSLSCRGSGNFDIVEQDQVRIATAIYPTTSLLNHSCEPSIVNSFQKDRLVVKTIRKILSGEQIFNCYGPHFRRMDFAERQSALQQQYFFKCSCVHCSKGLSADNELNSYTCQHCQCAISVEPQCQNCDVDCTERLKYCKNIEQASLDTFNNALSVLAQEDNQKMNVRAALKLFNRCLDVQTSILNKYHKKLGETYDAMGKCYALLSDYESSVSQVRLSLEIIERHYGRESVEATNELLKLSDVYMGWVQQLIDAQAKVRIRQILSDTISVIERTLRLVKMNKETGNEDIELLQNRLESLNKLKYLCQR